MNADRLLRIANRINVLLLRELGQGIDVERLLGQPLYARDVLLVCDALPGSDLASLAQHFRFASAEPVNELGHASTAGPRSTAFDPLQPASDSQFEPRPPPPQRDTRNWFSPGRWLGK